MLDSITTISVHWEEFFSLHKTPEQLRGVHMVVGSKWMKYQFWVNYSFTNLNYKQLVINRNVNAIPSGRTKRFKPESRVDIVDILLLVALNSDSTNILFDIQ